MWALGCAGSVAVVLGLVAPRHVGSFRTRDQTPVPCIGRQILNHWITKEVPQAPYHMFLGEESWAWISVGQVPSGCTWWPTSWELSKSQSTNPVYWGSFPALVSQLAKSNLGPRRTCFTVSLIDLGTWNKSPFQLVYAESVIQYKKSGQSLDLKDRPVTQGCHSWGWWGIRMEGPLGVPIYPTPPPCFYLHPGFLPLSDLYPKQVSSASLSPHMTCAWPTRLSSS